VSALIVEPSPRDAMFMLSALREEGFQVTVTEQFTHARTFLSGERPWLLLTALELGDYNGLHLLLHGKTARPEMGVLVISRRRDRVLQAEAERLGGTYLLKPVTRSELCAATWRTLLQTRRETKVVLPPFERRQAARRTAEPADSPAIDRRRGERRMNGVKRLRLLVTRGRLR
jgi:DNA-binding response OmpR family regulator